MRQNNPSNSDKPKRTGFVFLVLIIALISVFLISFMLGRYPVSVIRVLQVFASRIKSVLGLSAIPTVTSEIEAVVWNIRLPRILMACLVGCCLSCAGASYQGVFQNPMASPDILGASNGAAFGAALAILLGLASRMITIAAFVSSIATVALVFLVAKYAPGQKTMNLILAGIMIGSLFSAATSYIKLVADPSNQLPQITYWLMGSLSGVKLKDFNLVVIGAMVIGCAALFAIRWKINLLTLGDEEARSLGINTNRLRLIVIIASTLVTAASISVSGVIGWIGLVIPHIARKLVGSNYRYLIPASMISGAIFLLVVDNFSRNLLATEIPLGILTAFVGAPFFIYLILKRAKTF